jgi:hypothetical protein
MLTKYILIYGLLSLSLYFTHSYTHTNVIIVHTGNHNIYSAVVCLV